MLSKLVARRGHALINAACFSRGNWTGFHVLIGIGVAFRASYVYYCILAAFNHITISTKRMGVAQFTEDSE